MRARWVVPAALAVVLACAPARAELRARTRDLGAVSPVVDAVQWTTATTMTGSTCNARASDLLTVKGRTVTFSRSDSTLCCPESDASCCWAGVNEPCIHAPTYAGWASGGAVAGGIEVFGTTSNLALNSTSLEAASWLKTAGAVAANASASCPRAPDGSAAMHLITAAGTGDGVYDSLTGGNGVAQTFSAWVALATGDSACPITMLDSWGGTATVTRTLSEAPQRISVSQTGARDEFGVFFLRGSGGCARWCVWGPQVTKTATVQPYRATPGASSYTGTASTATTLTVPVALTDPSRWAIAWTGTHGTWRDVPPHGTWLWGLAPSSSANSFKMFIYDTDLTARIYDAAGTFTHRYITSAFSSGTHTVVASPGALYPDLWLDGVRQSGGATGGTGTGVMGSLPATLAIGKEPSGAGNEFNGLVSRVAQCKRAGGCR